MKVYDAQNIRNIVLAGHAGSGKTTFAESFLFNTGLINRRGAVEDHNTTSDYHELEHERTNSIFSAILTAEYKDIKINLIDTPGFDDFIGEMIAPMYVSEVGLILINAQSGVEVGAEHAFGYGKKFGKSVGFIVNKLDVEQANFDNAVEDIKSTFSGGATVFQFPVNQGMGFDTIVDLLSMKAYTYKDGVAVESEIPASLTDKAADLRSNLVESVAESDEELMNTYFEEGDLTKEQLTIGLKKAFAEGNIFPIFCACGKTNVGMSGILDFIKNVCPAPNEVALKEDEPKVASNEKTSMFCFKSYSDPRLGEMTYFKIKSGTVTSGRDMLNEKNLSSERIGQLFTILGKNRNDVAELRAGDIGATVKMKTVRINDTLHDKGFDIKIDPIVFPNYKMRTAVVPRIKGEEEKVGVALHALHNEDPTLVVEHSQELHQTILYAQGELHLAAAKWRLENRYKVESDFVQAKVPYRETITTAVKGSYRHKKQSGGAGQFAEVHMLIEPFFEGMPDPAEMQVRGRDEYPLPWGGKLVFLNCIVGGVIEARFLPAIMKGVMEKMENGPLTGSYVRDIRIAVYDGKMHAVDSNEAAFKMAGAMAFKEQFIKANPQILEPIYEVEIRVPDDYVGDIMSDLPTRRSMILGIDAEGKTQKIKTKMPLAELDRYATGLRSMTQARASFEASFAEFQAVPMNVQQELMEAYKKSHDDD